MIDYNRKLSNERETQNPSHKMSTLVLFETQTLLKLVSISYHFSNKVKACIWTMWIYTCVRGTPPRKILRKMVRSSAF